MFLDDDIRAAKKFVSQHKNLMLTKADKGNITVLVERAEYVIKMNELLSDTTTYREVQTRYHNGKPVDTNLSVQRKVNGFFTKLEKLKQINEAEAKHLRTYNSILGRAYGLFKVHKTGNPLHPIISCIDTGTYDIAQHFTKIIQNVVGKTERHIRNSLDFKHNLMGVMLPRNQVMLSLDVKSLFTNIPLDLVIKVIKLKSH